jgi:hypothetical protein
MHNIPMELNYPHRLGVLQGTVETILRYHTLQPETREILERVLADDARKARQLNDILNTRTQALLGGSDDQNS